MHRAAWLLVLAGVLGALAPAHAGQVRITLNSTTFDDNDVSMNLGDHVVWVWATSAHTVTSGTSPTTDGLFSSGALAVGTPSVGGTAFTWKSSVTGNRNYYCVPHASSGMTGILRIQNSGVAVSDFRITEVQYGAAGGLDRIEITNMGDAAGDLGRYRISISDIASQLDIVPLVDVPVPVGGRVTIHTNATGASTAAALFMGGTGGIGDLPASGSVALYAPYRLSTTVIGPLNTSTIIDFVQWGAADQPNSTIAESATLWTAGQFVSGEPLPAYSISFCGTRTERGAARWDVTTANFGGGGICTTPALNTSWGRIKTLYR